MKFKYIGDEATEWFGFKWLNGTVHDVTDAHAVSKLTNSALFEAGGAAAVPVRAPAPEPVQEVVDAEPDTFDETVEPTPKKKGGRQRKEVVTDDDPLSD